MAEETDKQIEETKEQQEEISKKIGEIKEQNEKIFEKLKELDGVKELKLKKVGKGQKKKGYVNYLFIRTNGTIEGLKLPIKELSVVHEGIPRIVTSEHILNYKGSPTIIQPEWSAQPFSTVESYEQAAKDKMLAVGYRILTNRLESGDVKEKKKISGWVILLLLIGLGVVAYLLLK